MVIEKTKKNVHVLMMKSNKGTDNGVMKKKKKSKALISRASKGGATQLSTNNDQSRKSLWMYTLPKAGERVGSKTINPRRSIDMPMAQASREEGWATKTSKANEWKY